jgi:hypothetical protein
MKKLMTLVLVALNSMLVAQEPKPDLYALEKPLLIGSVDKSDRITMELDKDKLVRTMNDYMPGKQPFDSVYIDTLNVDQKRFYFMVFKTKQSNKTLVKWLSLKGTSLIIEKTQEEAYKMLNAYFMCEGEQSCYPRLKKINNLYGWDCREIAGCVSEAYAKEHPCKCTKTPI